jgi:DNA-binding NarL/FixJ family response regulator
VVVLDLLLPDASGRGAYRAVRAAAPESGVVIFSISVSDRAWYEHRGAAYVPRDAGTSALVQTIKTLRRDS